MDEKPPSQMAVLDEKTQLKTKLSFWDECLFESILIDRVSVWPTHKPEQQGGVPMASGGVLPALWVRAEVPYIFGEPWLGCSFDDSCLPDEVADIDLVIRAGVRSWHPSSPAQHLSRQPCSSKTRRSRSLTCDNVTYICIRLSPFESSLDL